MREAREGPTVGLWLLVAVLVAGCVVGGRQVADARDSRAVSSAQHQRYVAALAAATSEVTSYVNVDHATVADDLARIAAGTTGPLKERYTSDADRFAAALQKHHTVTTGSVLWAGVVRIDADGATVLVATTGTRTDDTTKGQGIARDLRLRLELVPVDGRWLTSDIGLVD